MFTRASGEYMTLSIIIVHYKNLELLKLCLKSIRETLPLENLTYETLVIDSYAQPETGAVLFENFPETKYFPFKKNIGYAVGVNSGFKNSSGQYCLILNPDIVVTKGAISKMLEHLQNHPEVGLLGPRLLGFNGEIQNSRFRFYRPWTIACRRTFLGKNILGQKELSRFNLANLNPLDQIYPDWIMGSAILTRRETVEKVGPMDERFFLYFEDVDWARRFWENGFKVLYFPEAVMLHYHQRSSRAGFDFLDFFLRRETRWHIASGLKYFLKHGWRYRSGEELYHAK
ncbi:MAG: putative glycosyltransferase [Parcubacteria group bacterium Gr01-1014_44]|nr:MAG: putative glycosyltransferase [Parcubacteria group bacterium Gr01-1014_44]